MSQISMQAFLFHLWVLLFPPTPYAARAHLTALNLSSFSANNFAMKGKRKTLNASDVLSAMEEMEFQRFFTRLKEALEAYWKLIGGSRKARKKLQSKRRRTKTRKTKTDSEEQDKRRDEDNDKDEERLKEEEQNEERKETSEERGETPLGRNHTDPGTRLCEASSCCAE